MTDINNGVQGGVRRGRVVHEGTGTGDGVLALVEVQVLPDPPHAVDHAVVMPEGDIAGAHVDIAAGVAAHGVMAATVNADGAAAGNALHGHLEVPDVVVVEDELDNLGEGVVSLQDLGGEGTLQAARVVGEGIGCCGHVSAGQGQGGRAQVQLVVLERTTGDAASAATRGQIDGWVVA